jgi:hypothetical protein
MMHHSEKAKLKQGSYVGAGYKCEPVVSNEEQSYFYSSFNGLFSKHVFTENDAFIQLVSSHDYLVAIEPVAVPVVEIEPIVEVEPAVITPPKKKPGRKKKNVE